MPTRRRATSNRPFEAFEYQRRLHLTNNVKRFLAVLLIFGLVWLYRFLFPPPVAVSRQDFFDAQDVHKKRIKGETASDRRFLASIQPRPKPIDKSGIKLLDSVVASKLKSASKLRYIQLSNLKFCEMLNGAIVDSLAIVNDYHATIGQKNPTIQDLADLIDNSAQKSYNTIFDIYGDVDAHEAQRYACFATAEGANPTSNFTETRFSVKFDPVNYFSSVLPSIKSKPSKIEGPRRKYKLAYLIMVQEPQGFNQLQLLLDNLNDGNAIILIHVDEGANQLYKSIENYINSLDLKSRHIFLAEKTYANIVGHISLVYTNLSGFFELRDLADWDFVINLSNYDWPLRRNNEIHRILSLHNGSSYIDYWSDTNALASRLMRPHIGNNQHVNNYHPPELGITDWYFNFWQPFKQLQWMILSPEAIDHFRTDHIALNYLASMEHAYMPEESFFATVLFNSPAFRSKIIPDKKRYVRDTWGSWIGWKDRNLFPPGSLDPPFLFIRPFNALGDFFGETKLLEWIRVNHLDLSSKAACHRDQLGYREECLRELVNDVATNNEIILIPVNSAMLKLALNLKCSLSNNGIQNTLFWSLDIEAHEALIALGYLVYIDPNLPGNPAFLRPDDNNLKSLLRSKPLVIERFINAGFNVWYLDADIVAIRDFRTTVEAYKREPFSSDIILSVGNADKVPASLSVDKIPLVNAGIMYFKATASTKDFLEDLIKELQRDENLSDQDGFRKLLSSSKKITWTGIGTRALSESYPDGKFPDKNKEEEIRPKEPTLVGHFRDFFSFAGLKNEEIRIHFFDQFEFINGQIFFRHPELIPDSFYSYRIIHANGEEDPESVFKDKKFWYLDDSGLACIDPMSL